MASHLQDTDKKRFSTGFTVIVLIILVVVLSVLFLTINRRRGSDFSYTLSGSVNLTEWADGRPIILKDGWEFYPHLLLTPDMIHQSRQEDAREEYPYYKNVRISTDGWKDLGKNAELYSFGKPTKEMGSYGVGTYRIELLLDPDVDYMNLNFPSIGQAATIWINGKAARHYGVVSDNKGIYQSTQVSTNLQVEPTEDGRIEIVVLCANFSSPYGGILCSPCAASSTAIGVIEYSGRMFLTVLCAFWVFFLFGGYYISRTFASRSKLYFFLLMFLAEILYDIFAPMLSLLSGDWNMLIQTTLIILANYFSYLFYYSLYPRRTSKFFDAIRYVELSLFSMLTAFYLLTYWCFPNLLYLSSSVAVNLVLLFVTGAFNIFRVFYMARDFEHGRPLYMLSAPLVLLMHLAIFIRQEYYLYISFHAWLTLFLAVGYTIYFVVDYVRTYDKLSANNKSLADAVEEKTKYITRVNQDLLKNHEKLLENEEARKKVMSNVSHDLRTPITAIRGYIELMLNAKEPLSREQEVQYLSNMHTRSVQMEQLISDLVQLTRMESENDTIELMPISVKEMVGDLFQLYHAECEGTDKVITFTAPEDDDLIIDGDPKKLLRVFENIIVNAMKYTKDDGRIDITCHRYDDPAMLGGNAVEVLVKDNGVGIPANEVPYVFDRFYRAENSGINKTGSGLGLSIVKSVMDKHGGKIWAESEEGKGSEFHIVFKASSFSFDEEPEDEE